LFNWLNKGRDSNSENNPENDYPEEQSNEDDCEEKGSCEDNSEEKSIKEISENEDVYFEKEQENEFYESFKIKLTFFMFCENLIIFRMKNAKPKEFLEDDDYGDF